MTKRRGYWRHLKWFYGNELVRLYKKSMKYKNRYKRCFLRGDNDGGAFWLWKWRKLISYAEDKFDPETAYLLESTAFVSYTIFRYIP